MSQEIDLCEGSDDKGEWPNTESASVPSLPRSRNRLRDKEVSSSYAHPRNENGPGNKTATCSAEFVVDPERADEVEVSSHHRKRRGVMKSVRNAAVGNVMQIPKEVHATATEKDVANRHAHGMFHRESHEGIAAAASHPMNSDSEQTSRNDGSANKHSQKVLASKPPSKASGQQRKVTAWEDQLSELVGYCKIHGHCNVPNRYSENPKLGWWVGTQRSNYKFYQEGKISSMTTFRIQKLESLGFDWDCSRATWEDCLSELAEYRKIHGHCNVPRSYSENTKLNNWVGTQRKQYKLHLEGKHRL
jgi:hypothetical protein